MTSTSNTRSDFSIAFDTTAYSHLVRGNSEVATLLRIADLIVMPQQTVAELKVGFAFGSLQKENEAYLARFLTSNKVALVYPDEVTTEYYVALFSYARRKGRRLSHNDLWIAALAAQHGTELVSFDNDFDGLTGFKGLRLQVLNDKLN